MAGLLVLAAAGATGTAALDAAGRAFGAGGGDADLAARLGRVEAGTTEAAATLDALGATLVPAAGSARDAARLGRTLAASFRELAAALDLTLLGARPFAGLGERFVAVAADTDTLATSLGETATSLDEARAGVARLRDRIAELGTEVAAVRADVAGPGTVPGALGTARVLLWVLLAWLAVPALWASVAGAARLRGR